MTGASPDPGPVPGRLTVAGLGLLFFTIPLSISGMQAGLAVALAGAAWDLGRRRVSFPRTPVDMPVLLLLALTFLSALLSGNPGRGLRQFAGAWTVGGLYLTVAYGAADGLLKRLFRLLYWSAAAVALYAVFQHFSGLDFLRPSVPLETLNFGSRIVHLPRGGYNHYQTFANVFSLLFCIAFAQALHNRSAGESRLWKGAALLMGAVIVLSYTRGIWLSTALALLFITFLSGWKRALAGVTAAALLVGVLFAASPSGLWGRARTIAAVEDNVERLLLWETTWNMVRDNPLLGVGVGSYQRVQSGYIRDEVPRPMTRSHSHNIILQIAVERGVFGLLLFLWLWYLVGKEGFKVTLSLRRRGGSDFAFALGSLAGLFGFLFDGLFQNNFGDTEVVMLFWIVMGVLFRGGRLTASHPPGPAGIPVK